MLGPCINSSARLATFAARPTTIARSSSARTRTSPVLFPHRNFSSSPFHLFRSSHVYFSDAAAGEKAIYDKLKAKFGGKQLEVQDVSGGCGSFYAIHISSPLFRDLSTIKQHRLVNECLKEEVKEIHGLQLQTIAETDD